MPSNHRKIKLDIHNNKVTKNAITFKKLNCIFTVMKSGKKSFDEKTAFIS